MKNAPPPTSVATMTLLVPMPLAPAMGGTVYRYPRAIRYLESI